MEVDFVFHLWYTKAMKNKRHYKNYTDEDILEAIRNNTSMAGCLKDLGLRPAGGNFDNLKANVQRLNADTSHWTGKLWSKGQKLKDWGQYARGSALKPHLIKDRGNKCEECGLSEWRGEGLTIELHHKDGDRTNNELDNLQLLCPNCHSITKTWKGKNKMPA